MSDWGQLPSINDALLHGSYTLL